MFAALQGSISFDVFDFHESAGKQLGPNHVCVIVSHRRDTMYHADMILVFGPKFNTEKNKLEVCKF